MLRSVRRVVAGLDADGRSAVLYDGDATAQAENPGWPGFGVTLLWAAERIPAVVRAGIDEADRPMHVLPATGGTTCVLCEFPPVSSLDAMTPEQRAAAQSLVFGDGADGQSLALHVTPTLDYLVVLSGELALLLEAGETTVRAGDVVVNCGVKHGWENRGSAPAVCLTVMVDKA